MSLEWIEEGGPQGAIWRDWLGGRSSLLTALVGPHPKEWLGSSPPPNLEWLRAFSPAAKAELAARLTAQIKSTIGGELPAAMQGALQDLARPNAALVITGQQPGLWGGPCFTLWKALSAVVAARRLNDPALRPAWAAEFHFVPAFWVAGEDADVAEAARGYTWNAAGGVKAWNWAEDSTWGAPPHAALNDLTLGPAAAACGGLKEALEPTEHTAAVLELLREYGGAGETFSSAFVKLLTRVLGPLGMVVIESRMLAGVAARDRLAMKGIEAQKEIAQALIKAAYEIEAAKYEVGFPAATIERGPFVFLADGSPGEQGKARRRLTGSGAPYGLHQREGTRLTVEELQGILARQPERFTFGAPLRVLVQNSVLPTAAVVLGPGELTYWAQLRGLSDRLECPWPALLPRVSATALLSRHVRVLRKFGVGLEPFLREEFDPNRVLPASADLHPWMERQKALLSDLKAWFKQGGEFGKSEQKLQEKTAQKLEYEIDKFAARVARAHAEGATGESTAMRSLREFVHPHGAQERSLNWAVLLNMAGCELPGRLAEELSDAEQGWLGADLTRLVRHVVIQI